MRRGGILGILAVLGLSGPAVAAPQVSAGMTVGGAVTDLRTKGRGAFHLGARADVVFFRERERGMAVGPYIDLVTERLGTFEVGGGADHVLGLVAGGKVD